LMVTRRFLDMKRQGSNSLNLKNGLLDVTDGACDAIAEPNTSSHSCSPNSRVFYIHKSFHN
jgi:hypothetical protein